MNRRQLFTRLSALALAPLAKWLPKEEPLPGVTRFICCDVAAGIDCTVPQIYCHYVAWKQLSELEPIPQEEA